MDKLSNSVLENAEIVVIKKDVTETFWLKNLPPPYTTDILANKHWAPGNTLTFTATITK